MPMIKKLDGLELKKPFEVAITFYSSEDRVVTSIPELEIYGEAYNASYAIRELEFELLDLFNDLKNIPSRRLGKFSKKWKKIIYEHITGEENNVHNTANKRK